MNPNTMECLVVNGHRHAWPTWLIAVVAICATTSAYAAGMLEP